MGEEEGRYSCHAAARTAGPEIIRAFAYDAKTNSIRSIRGTLVGSNGMVPPWHFNLLRRRLVQRTLLRWNEDQQLAWLHDE